MIHNAVTPSTDIDAVIQQSYQARLTSAQIVEQLNGLGLLTAKGNRWTVDILGHYAKRHGLRCF